jgi:hypothetical protein
MGSGALDDEGGVDELLRAELLHSLPTRRLRLALTERLVAAKREVALIAPRPRRSAGGAARKMARPPGAPARRADPDGRSRGRQ